MDVISQEEWDQAHIANSTLIPLDELTLILNELLNGRDIVIICLSRHLSQGGVTILRKADFSRAMCMTNRLTAWKAAGYLVESNNP
jgi:rhodanese-related sulfurtransferase